MIRVLFVDDEMIVRVALKSMVDWSKTEFEIVGAVADAESALKANEQYHPQIIVTDLKLPKVDGIELVKMLIQQGYSGKIIFLSSYGEFEYAREALRYGVVDYLLKASFDENDLLTALRKAAKALPSSLLKENEQNTTELTQEQIKKLFYNSELPPMQQYQQRYLAVYFFLRSYFIDESNSDLNNNHEPLSNIIRECVGIWDGFVVSSITDKSSVLLYPVNSLTSDITEMIQRNCKKICDSVLIYMNMQAGYVLSTCFSDSVEFYKNLHACKKASALCIYDGFSQMIHQEDITAYTHVIDKSMKEKSGKIADCIILNEFDEAKQTVFTLFDSFLQEQISPEEIKNHLENLFDFLFLLHRFYNQDSELKEDCQSLFKNCITLSEYKNLCSKIIDEIRASKYKLVETDFCHDIAYIIEYINNNIHTKITLAQLSNAVNMTESYISRLFKSKTGFNLMSYVNMQKTQYAMILLKDPDAFAKEVAASIGYDDQSYFNRIFNRYVGISPIEFKKIYQSRFS